MYRRILLATDGSDLSLHAIDHGIALARTTGATVVGVYASPPFAAPSGFEFIPATLLPIEAYEESTREAAKRLLGDVAARARAAKVPCKVRHVRSLPPADAIVAIAQDEKCDLVVMGSHGYAALKQVWLGSVTTRVLARCTVPVLVHRDRPPARRKRAR